MTKQSRVRLSIATLLSVARNDAFMTILDNVDLVGIDIDWDRGL